jgi:DNA-directed RNA polymerase specialized sigma24 family protein
MSDSLFGEMREGSACNRRASRLPVLATSVRRIDCQPTAPQAAGGHGTAFSLPGLGQPPSLTPGAEAARMPTGPQPTLAHRRGQLLDELLRSKGGYLHRQAIRHSRSAEGAEEALQEAAVQFMRYFKGESVDHALPWMMTTVKRCAWAITRKARRGQPSALLSATDFDSREEESFVVGDDRPGPAELAERHAEQAETVRAFENLKPDERKALLMLGLGCSYAEIQQRRGWFHTKVNRCLAEGREAVRAELADGR